MGVALERLKLASSTFDLLFKYITAMQIPDPVVFKIIRHDMYRLTLLVAFFSMCESK